MRKDVYRTRAWQKIRFNVWLKQKCLCARCGKPVYVKELSPHIEKQNRLIGIVHHKVYLTEENYIDPTIAFDENNLEGLCIDCHNREHLSSAVIRDDVYFDENGQLKKKG